MSSDRPPGGHHRALAQLGGEPPAQAVDLAGEPVEGAGLDRLHRRLADHAPRLHQLDPAQGGGVGEQGVEADGHARGDGPAEVLTRRRDGVEGGGRAEVDHHARAAEQVVGPDGVGDPVGTHLLRVVVEDGHPALHAGLQHHGGDVEPASHHLAEVGGDQRDRRGHGDAGDTRVVDVEPVEVEQLGEEQGMLVGRALGHRGQPPVVGQAGRLVPVPGPGGGQGLAEVVGEEPDHGLGVSDIDGQQHGQPFPPGPPARSNPRSSTGAEWVRAPTEMRSAPAAARPGRCRG